MVLRKYAVHWAGRRRIRPLFLHQLRSLNTTKPISSSSSSSPFQPSCIHMHDSVRQALAEGRPVVALESTIVAHGMPYPENIRLSQRIATILRSKGVEPATIALEYNHKNNDNRGVARIGLEPAELEALAKGDVPVQKCSTRELSLFLANGGSASASDTTKISDYPCVWGATTVASTMVLAHRAGIPVFVTGGIGGVHRSGESSMDVSADLLELGRTPTIVVSAGIKSILDIPRTLQVLETNGVPTIAYGTDIVPAFFSAASGIPAPARMDTPAQVAAAYRTARALGLDHGMLVAVPPDQSNTDGDMVEAAIQQSLMEAAAQNVDGPAVTPFVLARVAELTGGASLRSNVALVERNAHVGADIAVALASARAQETSKVTFPSAALSTQPSARILVVGGILLDMIAKPSSTDDDDTAASSSLSPSFIPHTSNPAHCIESDGGVGRNIAEALGRLGSTPILYSAVGRDARGRAMLDRLAAATHPDVASTTTTFTSNDNQDDSNDSSDDICEATIRIVDAHNTATYLALLDGAGDLSVACADTDVLREIPLPSLAAIQQAAAILLDANPPRPILRAVIEMACEANTPVFWEPTSVPKASAISRDDNILAGITSAFPNVDELYAMATPPDLDVDDRHSLEQTAASVIQRMHPDEAYLVVTMGERGVLLATKKRGSNIAFQYFTPDQTPVVRNATGAGDSLCGAVLHAVVDGGLSYEEAIPFGMQAACLSLECGNHAISPALSGLKLPLAMENT